MEELILNEELWPCFRSPDLFDELLEIANQSFKKNSTDGYLSSILIYQQLVEEICWVLLNDCQFAIKIRLWDQYSINYKKQKGVMFGRLIEQLKDTIDFQNKTKLISLCNELNQIRIDIVHGLVKNGAHKNVSKKADKVKRLFEEIHPIFKLNHETFLKQFKYEKGELSWFLNQKK